MLPKALRAGNKVYGNVYGCGFLLLRSCMEIVVIVKRMIYRNSCTSVVPSTCVHIENISEINTFRV